MALGMTIIVVAFVVGAAGLLFGAGLFLYGFMTVIGVPLPPLDLP